MIDATELAQLQADATSVVLNQTATIAHQTRAWDAQGGHADTYPTSETVPCALTTSRPRLGTVEAQQLLYEMYDGLLVPLGTTVLPGDRITVAGVIYRAMSPSYTRTIPIFAHVDVLYDASLT